MMRDIYRLAISTRSHGHPADVSIGNTTDWLTHHSLRLEIDTTMEVIGTQLPEIPAQQQGEIKGRYKRIFWFFLCREHQRTRHQNHPDKASYLILQMQLLIHCTNIQKFSEYMGGLNNFYKHREK
jgi:hypothetical protein